MNDLVFNIEEPFFTTNKIILFSFGGLILLLIRMIVIIINIVYLFFVNKAIADQGGYKTKKYSKKSQKNKEVWNLE
jgi:hypothetical protein